MTPLPKSTLPPVVFVIAAVYEQMGSGPKNRTFTD